MSCIVEKLTCKYKPLNVNCKIRDLNQNHSEIRAFLCSFYVLVSRSYIDRFASLFPNFCEFLLRLLFMLFFLVLLFSENRTKIFWNCKFALLFGFLQWAVCVEVGFRNCLWDYCLLSLMLLSFLPFIGEAI